MRRMMHKHGIRSCREWYLKICAIIFGVTSTLLLTIPIGTNHWIYMEETITQATGDFSNTNLSHEYADIGEHAEITEELIAEPEPSEMEEIYYGAYTPEFEVRVHCGLWKICTLPPEGFSPEDFPPGDWDLMYGCKGIGYKDQVWNTRVEGSDTIFSILRAMRNSAFAVVVSVLVMVVAQVVGTVGIIKRNILTLIGGILMIIAALSLGTGLVFYITAVNDEVGHRKKPKVGEDASFFYRYSWGFIFAAVAYLGSNMAAVANIYLYQKRFNQRFEDLAEIVPGLEGIIAEVRQTYRPSSTSKTSNGSKELFVAESPVIVV